MELKTFEKTLKNNNGLIFDNDLILFNTLELYDMKNDKSIYFKSFDEFYDYKINDVSFRDIIIQKDNFVFEYDDKKRRSGKRNKMGDGFNHAPRGRGRKAEDYGATQFPARLNTETGGRYKSYEKTLRKFEKLYKNADIEYGASIDEQGFATRLIKGASTNVPISGAKGEMIIHNHPSGGNFSDMDLISISLGSEKGIVAVGSNTRKNRMRYSFTKTNHFKGNEFVKAVKKAEWPSRYSYDKGADWWLRKNAKKYGYKYSAVKIK